MANHKLLRPVFALERKYFVKLVELAIIWLKKNLGKDAMMSK